MLFALRAGLIAGLVSLVALGVLSVMAGQATDQGLRELEVGRLRFLVSSLRATVEANLNLGLPLQDLPSLQAQIERARDSEAAIRAIEIVGPNGVAVYSTDRGAIGEPVPQAWERAIEERRTEVWLADDRGEVAIGETIVNDFDQQVGHVVMVVAQEQVDPAASLALGLASQGWKAVLAAAALAFLVSFALARLRLRQILPALKVWRVVWDARAADDALARASKQLPSLRTASLRARRKTEAARSDAEEVHRRLTGIDDAV